MFGTLGGSELFLILVIALIVFGPRKLPDIGKSIGKMMVEFRKASNDFKQTIENEVEAEKIKAAVAMPMDVTTRLIDPPSAPPVTVAEAPVPDPLAVEPPGNTNAPVPDPLAPPSGTVPVDPDAATADSVPVAATAHPAAANEQ